MKIPTYLPYFFGGRNLKQKYIFFWPNVIFAQVLFRNVNVSTSSTLQTHRVTVKFTLFPTL